MFIRSQAYDTGGCRLAYRLQRQCYAAFGPGRRPVTQMMPPVCIYSRPGESCLSHLGRRCAAIAYQILQSLTQLTFYTV